MAIPGSGNACLCQCDSNAWMDPVKSLPEAMLRHAMLIARPIGEEVQDANHD
jgi:hypothetical protein